LFSAQIRDNGRVSKTQLQTAGFTASVRQIQHKRVHF
jgi:hypothetical protein